jgi:hypothetical protein
VSTESATAFGTPLPAWPVDHLRQLNWLPAPDSAYAFPTVIPLYAQVLENLLKIE